MLKHYKVLSLCAAVAMTVNSRTKTIPAFASAGRNFPEMMLSRNALYIWLAAGKRRSSSRTTGWFRSLRVWGVGEVDDVMLIRACMRFTCILVCSEAAQRSIQFFGRCMGDRS